MPFFEVLDAAVPGAVFASPTALQVTVATKAVGFGHGVLQIVKNYTGDMLNSRSRGRSVPKATRVDRVLVDDDLATDTGDEDGPGRRGTGDAPVRACLTDLRMESDRCPASRTQQQRWAVFDTGALTGGVVLRVRTSLRFSSQLVEHHHATHWRERIGVWGRRRGGSGHRAVPQRLGVQCGSDG